MGGSQQNIHQFLRCVLSGSWAPLIGLRQSSWSWPCPPGSAAFLCLELDHPWGLDVISREGRGSGRGHPWGEVPVFPSLPCRAFLPRWGPSAPGCQSLGQCVQ